VWRGDCCLVAYGLGRVCVGRCWGVVGAVDLLERGVVREKCSSFLGGTGLAYICWVFYSSEGRVGYIYKNNMKGEALRTSSIAFFTRSCVIRPLRKRFSTNSELVDPEHRQDMA
jgi:hypothetical protein